MLAAQMLELMKMTDPDPAAGPRGGDFNEMELAPRPPDRRSADSVAHLLPDWEAEGRELLPAEVCCEAGTDAA
jgi:hypothetical protein